ncbi:EMILIN-3 isoform X2 [Hippocampus comes]|uniref:EMILIN-3 isoform X2 n=1 Tax=Hippocampus comes TaxID=109280 RepID=UPI00094EF160|nr:PREDICTED: EMILIN-3-like isoform X2 [Hippocampus comes]
MNFLVATILFVAMMLCLSIGEAKSYRPLHYSSYRAGLIEHHDQGKPTSRHKNHCAYVIEKTVSFTLQDGAAPYVKAEYNKCSWHKKCPTLMYRLIYKPMYKVAHKTVTELEWRCCPGYSGYGCMEGPPYYQDSVKSMPPFKGPPFRGPQFKGPQYKSPMFQGSIFKGPPSNPLVKAYPWNQPKGPPTNGFNSYSMHNFELPRSSSYPDTSFESYPDGPEPMLNHREEHHIPHEQEHDHNQGAVEHSPEVTLAPSNGEPTEENATEERIYQIEEDVRRLNQGLESLRGTVNGLEESLRVSLREDANRMLTALLTAAPSPLSAPPVASSPSTVGFVEIPGGDPDAGTLDGRHVFSGLTELNGRVEKLRTELRDKTAELQELKATVMTHDGALEKISSREGTVSDSTHLERKDQKATDQLLDAKPSAARTNILGGFEKRVESAVGRCEEKAEDTRRQCQKEQVERQEQMEDALEENTSDLRTEMRSLRAQVHHLSTIESCCAVVSGLSDRVQLVEASVVGLNQSQKHLKVELGGHKDHVEGMLEGRLKYVETKLNLTGQLEKRSSASDKTETGQGLEVRMEDKLRELEGRLLIALEELGNATAPALLEGHAVPTLETELESLRGRLEMDVDRVQKHLSNLEILCSSSCSSSKTPPAIQGDSSSSNIGLAEDQNVQGLLDRQSDRLNSLNITLQNIMRHMTDKEQQEKEHGELTILKFNVRSVNRTLKGIQESLGTVVHQVGRVNSSWHERESRLAQQMKGVVQLVRHQASMLGAGERKLGRLRAELQEMKKRLADEVRGCRSTAMGVQKEVTEVGGRVANVEDQCKVLNYLAEDLERIREELDRQSNGFLLQFNGTLTNHSQQLTELKHEIRNCTSKAESSQQNFEPESQPGDTFTSK